MEGDGWPVLKHRLWSTVLFLGFCIYLFLCIGLQILLFRQYAGSFQGTDPINIIPLGAMLEALKFQIPGTHMPLLMWLQLAALMVPFGFCLFLWVEDCTSFRSIAAITLGFSSLLCGADYLLTAPLFNVDFIVSSLFGAFIGYSLALLCVELLYSKRIQPMLSASPKRYRKAA